MEMITIKDASSLKEEDLQQLYAQVNQQYCLVQIPIPLEKDKIDAYLEAFQNHLVNEKPFLSFGIYFKEKLIGKIEAIKEEDATCELDLVLDEAYTNLGYGKLALSQFIKILQEKQWARAIIAYVNQENHAIRKVLEACDFQNHRNFKADILVPYQGTYSIREIEGMSYMRMI